MQRNYTTHQAARALGVSESSVKRWCDQGLLASFRTVGGHRRLPSNSLVQFIRRRGIKLERPEEFDLPPGLGSGQGGSEAARSGAMAALQQGDAEMLRGIVLDLYFQGLPLHRLFDEVLAPCFHQMGHLWEKGELKVHQERRACEITQRVMHELSRMLMAPDGDQAPLALGGTGSGDTYSLPTFMVELVFRELGWEAESYGNDLPIESLQELCLERKPRILWVSYSCLPPGEEFIVAQNDLFETITRQGTSLIIGGRALDEEIRKRMLYSAYCENLARLVNLVKTAFQQENQRMAQ